MCNGILRMAHPCLMCGWTTSQTEVTLRNGCLLCSRLHSVDKAALYEETGSDRSVHRSPWGSVTVSREAFELLRLKDRAMDNVKEGITIADCRQEMPYTRVYLKHRTDNECKVTCFLWPVRVQSQEGKYSQCCIHCRFEAWLLQQRVKHVISFLCSQADMPLIYANEAFARITGYSVAESLGKNCRFLQVYP